MRTSIFGTYTDPADARNAIGALLDHGAQREDISLVIADPNPLIDHVDEVGDPITTTTSVDAAAGASAGAGIGLGLGTVAALAAVTVPGAGVVLGGGALALAACAVFVSAASGAVVGGVTGYLKDQGVPEEFIESSSGILTAGGAVVAVTVPSGLVTASLAASLMRKYGASGYKSWQTAPGMTPSQDSIAALIAVDGKLHVEAAANRLKSGSIVESVYPL